MFSRRRPSATLVLREGKEPGTLDIKLEFVPKRRLDEDPPYAHKTALVALSLILQALNDEVTVSQ